MTRRSLILSTVAAWLCPPVRLTGPSRHRPSAPIFDATIAGLVGAHMAQARTAFAVSKACRLASATIATSLAVVEHIKTHGMPGVDRSFAAYFQIIADGSAEQERIRAEAPDDEPIAFAGPLSAAIGGRA